jgi:hypothetical protein
MQQQPSRDDVSVFVWLHQPPHCVITLWHTLNPAVSSDDVVHHSCHTCRPADLSCPVCTVHSNKVGSATVPFRPEWDRHRLTPRHTAYLRVAEGCDHKCTFCAIPGFRGRFRSKPWAQLLVRGCWVWAGLCLGAQMPHTGRSRAVPAHCCVC